MSLPATDYWFSLSARRNRKSFMLANLMLLAILACVFGLLLFFDARGRAGLTIYFLFYIPFIVAQYFLTAQRLRDFGVTGWLTLLWIAIALVPPPYFSALSLTFLLILCSVPGTVGSNRYGSDPLQNS